MAKFDPEKHHRRSIRLPHYDYAQAGAYFVTLCVQDKACLLGQIRDGETQLNDAGQMVARWWDELNRKFPGVRTDAVVIMPNHVHGILVIETAPCAGQAERICRGGPACPPDQPAGSHTGLPQPGDGHVTGLTQPGDSHVGAGRCARPTTGGSHTGLTLRTRVAGPSGPPDDGPPGGNDPRLGDVIRWFKTMSTNEYMRRVRQAGWPPFPGRLWQRNYYERVIRNERELNAIRQYILNNPLKWAMDSENPDIAKA